MMYSLLALLAPAAMATMTPNLPRGEKIVARNASEVCIIPQKLDVKDYSDKDIKNEIGLCNMEINGADANVAVCGKVSSTNPGVEFFRLPKNLSASQLEAQGCKASKAQDPDDQLKKLAKYKNSTSCSYTPSILAYYHVSRILGDLNQVPVAVLRTMDINRHIKIGNTALAHLKASGEADDTIVLTWSSLLKFLNQGAASSKRDALMTDDFKQSYGALQKNPTNEEKYSEMYFGGSDQNIRAQKFRDNSPIYRLLKTNTPASKLVSTTWSTENVQKVQQMKNVADLILMDTMLSQEDRFGNVHYSEDYYFIKEGNVKHESNLTADEVKTLKAVKIKNMMLKDNDCGVNRENHLKNNKLLAGLSHVNPETYHKLLKLNAALATDDTKLYFKRETMMTESDFAQFKQNVGYAVATLQGACKQGRLQLDLDLDGHFAGIKQNTACE